MFGWSQGDFSEVSRLVYRNGEKIQVLRKYYEGIDMFIIDEVNAMSAAEFTFLHGSLPAIKNKDRKKNAQGNLLPFGGVLMVFMGDTLQLALVAGPPIYGKKRESFLKGKRMYTFSSIQDQQLYKKRLVPNCIFLQKGQRNRGIFGKM